MIQAIKTDNLLGVFFKRINQSDYFLKKIFIPKQNQKGFKKHTLNESKIKKLNRNKHKNQKGQGMTEYLIIVAIIAVASIAVVRTVGGSVRTAFAKIAISIQGDGKASSIKAPKVSKSQYKRNDMSDFANGAVE